MGRPLVPSQETLEKYQYVLHLYNNKHIAIDKSCKKVGISKTTFYQIDKKNFLIQKNNVSLRYIILFIIGYTYS
ncbi:helix-turn-helix domain-containing protein [Capnocytophaga sputigena]|uniref:helix-turn-helix domain-containing protein n=1 Tax=Capnocytophaga sputigena TaxID=1019 RepID=UPI0028D2A57C|nr:helix-turn-helix domain-containing protein [Capnocytophaga sputigena]